MHMTSLLKSSLDGLSGSSGETVAEGARRATGEMVSPEAARRDPEVVAIARRRNFSGSEKRRLLAEGQRGKEVGTFGAFLRRETEIDRRRLDGLDHLRPHPHQKRRLSPRPAAAWIRALPACQASSSL